MNDTSRDELRETIAGIIGNYGYQCINTESGYHESPDEEPIATEIIEAVTAARDAEIQNAMLHADVIDTIHSQILYFGTTEQGVKLAVEYALGMIGLSDGTGGQG